MGRKAWNKGLTKEIDERVAGYAKTKTGKKRPNISEKYKGKGNPNYKNGIRTGKRMMLEIHRICEICNSDKNLEVHHIDGNRNNNILDNLKVLCRSCHSKEHRGKEWHLEMINCRRVKQNAELVC
ncbi:hypothetical protein ES702_01238 [subsurface metagenome]